MADAETLTDIIELIVGMVDAAPGADILAELEIAVDAGASIEDLAVAIAANPAWSGDTGLFPDFLPDAIFADQWITQLMGDSVDEDTLAEAIDEMTTLLTGGTGRGEAMYATIVALAATTDPDLADASATLANKTAVAEYYSIDVAQSSEELDDLIGVLDGVDETEASADTATDAIDDDIAANAPLVNLITDLQAANAAKDAFLADADGDSNPLTSTSDAAIEAARLAAEALVDADPAIGAGYIAGSAGLKAALIADAATADALTLAGLNTTLTAAQSVATGTGGVTGLDSAIAVFEAAVTASDAAIEAAALAVIDRTEAVDSFDVTAAPFVATDTGGGTYTDGTNPMIVVSGVTLALATGVTEATHPGVTALLTATLADLGAAAAAAAALTAANDALDIVENLDQNAGRTAQLGVVAALMNFITPATAGEPTVAEMTAEQAALDAGIAQLVADLQAVTTSGVEATDEAALTAIVTAAATAGFIGAPLSTVDLPADILVAAGDQATLDTAVAQMVAEIGTPANAAPASGNIALDFANESVTTMDTLGTAYTGGMTVAVGLALAPLALAENAAQGAVDAEVLAQAGLATNIAAEQAQDALQDTGAALDLATAAAGAAFGDAGFEAPVDLDSAVKAATADDDIFLADGIDSQIISFGGDDVVYIGDGFTLNADTTAGDEGDNSVLEVWITGTTSAVITVETSVFGSEAAVPETFSITLTGVAAADLTFADGFISIG